MSAAKFIVPIFIVLAVFGTRFLPLAGDSAGLALVANLTPLVALSLCGGAFFQSKWLVALPLVAFVVSDVALNAIYGAPLVNAHTFMAFLILGCLVGLGLWLRKGNRALPVMLGATIGGVLAFYLVTNTGSFFTNPAYPRSFEGWVQCLTVGVPGFAPTWTFLLKSLVGNTVFAAIFCYIFNSMGAEEPQLAGAAEESAAAS